MSEKEEQLEARLVRSETSLAHLAHDLEQINEVVVEHTRDLHSITQLIRSLDKRLKELEEKDKDT
jgi:uncharacterized coiled-coil protein SlyX